MKNSETELSLVIVSHYLGRVDYAGSQSDSEMSTYHMVLLHHVQLMARFARKPLPQGIPFFCSKILVPLHTQTVYSQNVCMESKVKEKYL